MLRLIPERYVGDCRFGVGVFFIFSFSAMFDWNDEELTNIIWGETGESDDHIVPYPDESDGKPPASRGDSVKEEWDLEASNAKPGDQKKPALKSGFDIKLESSSKHATDEALPALAFGKDSWPDLSLSNTTKMDQGSSCKETTNDVTEISKHEDGTAQPGINSEIFQKQQVDGEQSDFIDYGWDNIGSFDDLDKIFSNDDPIFGHTSLSNTEELWPSSKDLTSSPDKSIPMSIDSPSLGLGALRSTSEKFETKAEYMLDRNQPFARAYGEVNNITPNVSETLHAYAGGKNFPIMKEKTALEMVGKPPAFSLQLDTGMAGIPNQPTGKFISCVQENLQKRPLKGRIKSEEQSQISQLQDICGSWSSSMNQLNSHYISVNQHCPPVGIPQPRHLQVPQSLQYKQYPGHMLASPVSGDFSNQYPMPALTQFHAGQGCHQSITSGYDASPRSINTLNKSSDAPSKSLMMTPQEKIEKLRRRQQMRAMLAIQRQQQQFGNQVLSTDHSMTEGGNAEVEESLCTIPTLDPNSPLEQNDSNTVGIAVEDRSMEESVLYRLQDIISKLDIRIRLCIRDSLFRLAQSAAQRRHANDTSSTNKGSKEMVPNNEEINSNRIARLPNVETETNPIDRTVAHLLFHQPMDLSPKVAEMPESQLSDKLYYESKATCSLSLPTRNLPPSSESHHAISPHGVKTPSSCPEGEQPQNSPCLEASENASNNEAADSGVVGVEPSTI
ncbi:protein LNK2-like isoform X1 [Ipomoea triloba]|uniref:protein LNK2-like isoform X1 n=1 Tax=Ipomoea triloba TaxID=35885 RepID=UPI00125E87AD|nr:protein LNK2-like isoform X1 [Ipomoea triloba]XP_031091708.1 protein LNK2-like isoform X1 [Ipomoea triloba]XP_031091709.1 protein LNK2-like isoform X1 [Ipomoea triloba]